MPVLRTATVAVVTLSLWIASTPPVFSQSLGPYFGQNLGDPDDARVQAGPLAMSPAIRLTNFGFDSNVFNENEASDPQSDVTGTLSPIVTAWLRLPHARVSGRSELDFVYFRQLSNLRALDTINSARAEVLLHRLRPYVAGTFRNTRHRQNIEIDEPVRVRERSLVIGTDLRLTGKSSFNLRARNSTLRYDDAVYFESNLGQLLNRTTTGEGLTFKYAATPLTAIGLDVERQRDRFGATPERDSDRLRVSPFFEFSPHALVEGRAQFGVFRRSFTNRDLPDARGTFMQVDLRYTLLGGTQFAVRAERDLEYSYRTRQEEYQLAGFTASVIERLADPWDVRASVGRYHLTYVVSALDDDPSGPTETPRETVMTYGVGVGYRIGETRLAVQVLYRDRTSSEDIRREFERVRIASSLTYNFDWGLPSY